MRMRKEQRSAGRRIGRKANERLHYRSPFSVVFVYNADVPGPRVGVPLCLDSNIYVDPTDTALQNWIEADLKATDAAWKFVVCHHPAFNSDHHSHRRRYGRQLAAVHPDR